MSISWHVNPASCSKSKQFSVHLIASLAFVKVHSFRQHLHLPSPHSLAGTAGERDLLRVVRGLPQEVGMVSRNCAREKMSKYS